MKAKCDICRIEFPNSVPNFARYDAPILGAGGAWGYLCETHKSRGVQSMLTELPEESAEDDWPAGYDPDEDRSPDSFDPPDRDERGEW